MSDKLNKNDFVEIAFTGKVKDTNEIFDTNIKEEAEKLNIEIKTRPLIICLGQGMILPSIDNFLIGKETGKDYELNLESKNAFGIRRKELIRTMPLSVFRTHNMSPERGMMFAFDSLLGKIISNSGGRVIVDFNNPLSGKDVIYYLKPKRKIQETNEKVKSLISAFFKHDFEFELKDKNLVIKAEKQLKQFIEIFKEKFKEILDLELVVEEILPK